MNYFDEIFSYCEGEMSYEEMQRFEAKLATDPALQTEFAAYRKGEMALDAILIDGPVFKPTDQKKPKINPGRFLAGILLLAFLVVFLEAAFFFAIVSGPFKAFAATAFGRACRWLVCSPGPLSSTPGGRRGPV